MIALIAKQMNTSKSMKWWMDIAKSAIPGISRRRKMAYKKIKPAICPQCGHQFDIEYLEKVINAGLQLAELTVEMGEEIGRILEKKDTIREAIHNEIKHMHDIIENYKETLG